MDLSIIRTLAQSHKGGIRNLAYQIGMTEANLHRCINNNRIQAGDLERVASILGVSPLDFFDKSNNTKDSLTTKKKVNVEAMKIGKLESGDRIYRDSARHEELELYAVSDKSGNSGVSPFKEFIDTLKGRGNIIGDTHEVEKLKLEIKLQKEKLDEKERLIAEKDKRISDKDELIETLRNSIKSLSDK